jgi:hypothetical protein
MKGTFRFVRKTIVASLLSTSTLLVAHGGLLDILRGEREELSAQRVAFIGAAEVKEVTGSAEHLAGIDTWSQLQPGTKLQPGDIIRTSKGSVVLQMVESESFVKVTPNTILRLVPVGKDGNSSILSGGEERDGFVVRGCRGKAYVKSGSEWRGLAVNELITRSASIRTEAGALVDLFDTESKRPLRIPGATRVRLDDQMLAGRVIVPPSLAEARR